MELVYLWVEDYKNIHHQGFNFSGRYRCDYDSEKNELTIDENKEYVHIFPDNINVTAIVGENGSGKSSIIELIKRIFLYTPNIELGFVNTARSYPFNFILVFSREQRIEYISNLELQSFAIEKANVIGHLDYYLYLAEDQIPQNEFGEKNDHQISLAKSEIANMICSSYINNIDFKLTTFMYLPKEIEIEVIPLHNKFANLKGAPDYSSVMHYDTSGLSVDEEQRRDRDLIREIDYREESLNEIFADAEDEFHQFLVIWYIRANGYDDNEYQLRDKEYLLSEFSEVNDYISEEEYTQLFQNRNVGIHELRSREKDIYFKYYKEYFNFDFIDSRERRFNDLSHGEQTIFGQLLNIYYHSLKSKNNIILLFNEPDLSLHPQWQKMYFSEVLNLLKKIPRRRYSFIFTTHSPFLLSDLQTENIIFLEDGKQVYPNIDTFGANIHTLLSHGFFMKDGLIGEFAKEKINQIINYLNDKESEITDNETAQKFINIIGEPILKRQLQKMLDSKRLSRIDEIDELKKRIALLESNQ